MGAAYFIPRDWFLRLNPLAHIRQWGSDEMFLSVKCWLAGGDVRLMRNVQIGHKFTLPTERQPFSVGLGMTVWNKLLAIHTLLPPKLAETLTERLKRTVPPNDWFHALEFFKANYAIVAIEQASNRNLFVHDFHWLAERFALPLP